MKKKFNYTADHLLYLKIGYLLMHVADLTRAFNRKFNLKKTETQIKSALKNHGIKCGRAPKDRLANRRRLFTREQERFVRDNYKGRSAVEMTSMFNRRFGTDRTLQQIKTFVHNRRINSGLNGQFKKGCKPWNTGTKGLTGANANSFKKGNVPPNRKPLGSERICSKKGFILIKVAEQDPYTGFPSRYKHKHVHVWEQAHGPIPKGMVVAFRNGDKFNTDINNLMLISRAELLRLNRHGYKDMPDKLKPSVLALAKLEVKTFSALKKSRAL